MSGHYRFLFYFELDSLKQKCIKFVFPMWSTSYKAEYANIPHKELKHAPRVQAQFIFACRICLVLEKSCLQVVCQTTSVGNKL